MNLKTQIKNLNDLYFTNLHCYLIPYSPKLPYKRCIVKVVASCHVWISFLRLQVYLSSRVRGVWQVPRNFSLLSTKSRTGEVSVSKFVAWIAGRLNISRSASFMHLDSCCRVKSNYFKKINYVWRKFCVILNSKKY